MKIVILDRLTLGLDIDVSIFEKFGEVVSYDFTKEDETLARINDADIVITNKVVIDKNHMDNTNIKLICITATGMNNVDLVHAKEKNIEVKNVAGYSTSSVVQVAFSMIFWRSCTTSSSRFCSGVWLVCFCSSIALCRWPT